MSLYDDLGVARGADAATIKAAYRKKRGKLHPDRKGGDGAKFHAVLRAYNVLADPRRRETYDRTGDEGAQPVDERGQLLTALAMMFLSCIEQLDPDSTDIVAAVRDKVGEMRAMAQKALADHERRIKKRERTLKRLTRKRNLPPGADVLAQIIEADISAHRQHIAAAQAEIDKVGKLLALVAEYEYDTKGMQRQRGYPPSGLPWTGGPWR